MNTEEMEALARRATKLFESGCYSFITDPVHEYLVPVVYLGEKWIDKRKSLWETDKEWDKLVSVMEKYRFYPYTTPHRMIYVARITRDDSNTIRGACRDIQSSISKLVTCSPPLEYVIDKLAEALKSLESRIEEVQQ